MNRFLATLAALLYLAPAQGVSQFVPAIQCTVIKVHNSVSALGFDKFPLLYHSINYDPASSRLAIGSEEFTNLTIEYNFSYPGHDVFVIKHQAGELVIELTGEPMSRSGELRTSEILIGDLTCH